MGRPGSSWFGEIFSHFFKPSQLDGPGKVWSSNDAERAFYKGAMNSKEARRKVRVAFRNQSKLPLILSWVAENGKPHHFYSLNPAEVLEGPVTSLDHVENTNLGHAFCIAHVGSEEERIRKDKILDPKYVVGGYRPDFIGQDIKEDDKDYIHLVTISQKPAKKLICCSPSGGNNLRGSHQEEEVGNDFDDLCWIVEAKESCIDDKQINTCVKKVDQKKGF